MVEHYDAETLQISRGLYESIKKWSVRGGVTLIGGWAVFERVDPEQAQQSRDVDLILHDLGALRDFDLQLSGWNLQWRRHGRNRFNDCHLIGDDPANIRVDVFKHAPFADHIFTGFAMRAADIVKPAPCNDWLPSTGFLVRDKLTTVPLRVRDRGDKRLKDLIDLHGLTFHNIDGVSAAELADETKALRKRVLPFLRAARKHDAATRDGTYAERLDELGEWLRL